MDRNPISRNALTVDGLREGREVDIHFYGGHISRVTITSQVFSRFRLGMGNLPSVAVRHTDGREDTLFLADMGVCPDHRGQ